MATRSNSWQFLWVPGIWILRGVDRRWGGVGRCEAGRVGPTPPATSTAWARWRAGERRDSFNYLHFLLFFLFCLWFVCILGMIFIRIVLWNFDSPRTSYEFYEFFGFRRNSYDLQGIPMTSYEFIGIPMTSYEFLVFIRAPPAGLGSLMKTGTF